MKTNTGKIEKPLKKVKALKKEKEDAEKLVKPAVRIQELKKQVNYTWS
jgi:hypothetical protein